MALSITAQIKLDSKQHFQEMKKTLNQNCIILSPKVNEEYIFERVIGKSGQTSFSQVSPKIIQDGNLELKYAIKTYKFQSSNEESKNTTQIYKEIEILRSLRFCKSIINLEQVYEQENQIHLVLQTAKYGSLKQYILNKREMKEDQIRHIMGQLLIALDFMHKKGIFHRDLKADNVLILEEQDLEICIMDLSLACFDSDKAQMNNKCGTPGNVDPDVLNGLPFNQKSDIFSLGCLFYHILTGKNLFQGDTVKQILFNNKYWDPINKINDTFLNVSEECTDLLRKMVNIDSYERPIAEECLSHSWFSKEQESLQNLLQHNRRASINNTIQGSNGSVPNDYTSSFQMGPDYFKQNDNTKSNEQRRLAFVGRQSKVLSKLNSQFSYEVQTDKIVRGNVSDKADSCNKKNERFTFQIKQIDAKDAKKTTFYLMHYQEEIKEEVKSPSIKDKQKISNNDTLRSFQFDQDDFNEGLMDTNEFDQRVRQRVQINKVKKRQKPMSMMNSRRNSIEIIPPDN